MTTKTCVMLVLSAACLSSLAKTNTWTATSQAGRWAEASNWKENRTLEAGDYVSVPDGLAAVMNDADIAAMKDLIKAVMLNNTKKSSLELNVTGEDNVVTWRVNVNGESSTSSDIKLIKSGTGKVLLDPFEHNNYTYGVHLIVNEGTLQLPVSTSPYNLMIPKVTVNSPGVLITSSGCDNAKFWAMNGLGGDGTVTNPTSQNALIYMGGSTVFSGKLLGPISIMTDTTQTCNGEFRTTEATSASEHSIAGNSLIGLESIGGTSPDGQTVNYGSIGRGSIAFRMNPGIRYLGRGETAYPYIYANSAAQTFTFDGGPCGGLELARTISFSSATATLTTLILKGTNSAPCTLNGTFTSASASKGRVTNLRKTGSGTWCAAQTLSTDFTGLVSVEDGTLQFGSLAESGIACSLGTGSSPVQDVGYSTESLDTLRVPYAWLLGNNATTGTLEYVGAAAASCSFRPLAVRGTGRVTSSGGPLSLAGASSAVAGTNTLVLAGETGVNRFSNVADGETGSLAVVKEGAGTWRLSGNLAFTGGIDVKAGTLEIGKTDQYQFYRFEAKERLRKNLAESQSMHYIGKLALFNEAGVMQNANLVVNSAGGSEPWKLKAGECALRVLSGHAYWTDSNTVDRMFKGVNENNMYLNALDPWYYYEKDPKHTDEYQRGNYPWLDDPDSWAVVYFRLPTDADEIVSYDLGAAQASSNPCQTYSWTLSGSYDGRDWVTLSTVISNAPAGTLANTWYSNGAVYTEPADGRPIVTRPATAWANGTAVAVAPGATLRSTEGGTITALSATTAGMGTVDGFVLAGSGVLKLTGTASKLRSTTLPVTFVNCTGDLSGWTVSYNGQVVRNASAVLTPNGITVYCPGMALIVR